jgi:single-strand DNA-binding protein
MVGDAQITVEGNVGGDVDVRFLPSGKPVASFSVAYTPSRWNKEASKYEDKGTTIWFKVSAWGKRGENAAEIIRKGDRVTVSGSLSQSSWTSKDGEQRSSLEIDASVVGVVPRAGKTASNGGDDDPWNK